MNAWMDIGSLFILCTKLIKLMLFTKAHRYSSQVSFMSRAFLKDERRVAKSEAKSIKRATHNTDKKFYEHSPMSLSRQSQRGL